MVEFFQATGQSIPLGLFVVCHSLWDYVRPLQIAFSPSVPVNENQYSINLTDYPTYRDLKASTLVVFMVWNHNLANPVFQGREHAMPGPRRLFG